VNTTWRFDLARELGTHATVWRSLRRPNKHDHDQLLVPTKSVDDVPVVMGPLQHRVATNPRGTRPRMLRLGHGPGTPTKAARVTTCRTRCKHQDQDPLWEVVVVVVVVVVAGEGKV